MIITKKIYLSWDKKNSGWVYEQPEKHNGILNPGAEFKGSVILQYNSHGHGIRPGLLPNEIEFTLKEFVEFIKNGTIELEEDD